MFPWLSQHNCICFQTRKIFIWGWSNGIKCCLPRNIIITGRPWTSILACGPYFSGHLCLPDTCLSQRWSFPWKTAWFWTWWLQVTVSLPSSPELKQLLSSQNVGVLLGTSSNNTEASLRYQANDIWLYSLNHDRVSASLAFLLTHLSQVVNILTSGITVLQFLKLSSFFCDQSLRYSNCAFHCLLYWCLLLTSLS